MTPSLQTAARRALEVLRTVQDTDADSGVSDPDIADAIEMLRAGLSDYASAKAQQRKAEAAALTNRWGFVRGELLRVTRGTHAGTVGEYAGACSSKQIYVRRGEAKLAVTVSHVERIEA